MRRRIARSALISAACCFTLTALAMSGAAAASASITTGYDEAFSGYATGGPFTYRFVQTDTPVAKCRAASGNNATATAELFSTHDAAFVDVLCGGGRDSVRWSAVGHGHGSFSLAPEVGQVLRISVFRNYSTCRDSLKAVDLTTGASRTVTVGTNCAHVYRFVFVGAFMNTPGQVMRPAASQRLWTFRNSAVTSKNGRKGTLCAPWPVAKFIATTTGTSSGVVLAFPGRLANGCRNFFVSLKGTG